MALRVVFAAALAVALLAVATPAIDDARRDTSAASARGDLATVERAARSLLVTDERAPGAGPRRSVTVRLPPRSWTASGLAYLSLGGPPGGSATDRAARRGVAVYRVRGGEPRRLPLDVPLWAPDPVVLREPGRHRLVLTVERVDGRRVVVVSRAD